MTGRKTPGQLAYEAYHAPVASDPEPNPPALPWRQLLPVPTMRWHAAAAAGASDERAKIADLVLERGQLRGQLAAVTAERDRLAAQLRIARRVLARILAAFGVPDDRRMRHADVTASTIERWQLEAASTAPGTGTSADATRCVPRMFTDRDTQVAEAAEHGQLGVSP